MPEGETLPGRSGITHTLFDDCIRRPADGSARDLPLVVLLGARGSGKTWVLKHLRNSCHESVAIPYTFIDCTDPPNRSVWRLIGDVADAWYGARFGHSERSGLSVLVELNRLYHTNEQRELADRRLCEAFLDDLNDAFARRRKFNCTVLHDNCDDPAETGFLNLLADLRSGRAGGDPLFVVAASRTVPDLTGLDRGWTFPWETDQPGISRVPNPDKVSYSSWQDNHVSGTNLAPWWYPVHLRDLTPIELRRDHERLRLNHTLFIHRFTDGHQWSAYRVHRWDPPVALKNKLPETELLDIPVKFAPQAAEYLLADLQPALRTNLVRWSAARDIGTAAAPGGGCGDLRGELEKRLWLVAGNPMSRMRPGDPRLRRILQCELAATSDIWSEVHNELRNCAVQEGHKLDVAYHELACGDISPAVEYLAGQFGWMDANSWIQEFNAVTDAPGRPATGTPVEHHEKLVLERGPLDDGPIDRQDRVRNALWSMVAARWIWSDQLGDPKVSLKDTIADGYVLLADESRAGSTRYRREARAYREMRAW